MNSKRTLVISILAVFIILAAFLPFSQFAPTVAGIFKAMNSTGDTPAQKIVVEVYPGSNNKPDQNWEHVWGDQGPEGKPVVNSKQELGWDHVQGGPTPAANDLGWGQISGK